MKTCPTISYLQSTRRIKHIWRDSWHLSPWISSFNTQTLFVAAWLYRKPGMGWCRRFIAFNPIINPIVVLRCVLSSNLLQFCALWDTAGGSGSQKNSLFLLDFALSCKRGFGTYFTSIIYYANERATRTLAAETTNTFGLFKGCQLSLSKCQKLGYTGSF